MEHFPRLVRLLRAIPEGCDGMKLLEDGTE